MQLLDELLEGADNEQEAAKEQDHLEAAIQQYKRLMPHIEATTVKASTRVKCLELKDNVEQKTNWLEGVTRESAQPIVIEDLGNIKEMLAQQEVCFEFQHLD